MSLSSPMRAEPELARLLRDLGPSVQRGARAAVAETAAGRRVLATGIPAIDQLVSGGVAAGCLSELSGPLSSGRTSVALALLARATEAGEVVGVVDGADVFHPASALAVGVRLDRVLWARPPGVSESVRCCERLLQARGFAAVLLDTARHERQWAALPAAAWQRLTRAAAATGTALVVLSRRRVTGSFADLSVELRSTLACFSGAPSLFEGLEIEAVATRQRRGPLRGPAMLRLHAEPQLGASGLTARSKEADGRRAASRRRAKAGPCTGEASRPARSEAKPSEDRTGLPSEDRTA